MTSPNLTDFNALCNQIASQTGDAMRQLLQAFVEQLMGAEVEQRCGAPAGVRTEARTNQRNGYRERRWDTRMGSVDLQVPKLRRGTYFPDWLLERRRRAEQALEQVIAECNVLGVSTRRVDGLVKALGIEGIDKSQVSAMSKGLDARVQEFRDRPLDASPYPYVWVDALYMKVREGGRVVSVAVAVASAVNGLGKREIVGLDTFTNEDTGAWICFLRRLLERGLHGVDLVIFDAHLGLKAAIEAVLPGSSWQRCRTHAMKNLLSYIPKHTQEMVATLVRSVFAQPDATAVRQQFGRVASQLERSKFLRAAEALEDGKEDLLAFTAYPKRHWRQIWSNNPQERLNREIRRRTDVVGIFPDRASIIRLVGSVLAEQHDEWVVSRRYMTLTEAEPESVSLDALPLTSNKENE